MSRYDTELALSHFLLFQIIFKRKTMGTAIELSIMLTTCGIVMAFHHGFCIRSAHGTGNLQSGLNSWNLNDGARIIVDIHLHERIGRIIRTLV